MSIGQPAEVVAYADKAAERLRRKFQKVASHANYNIAKTAVARELACFIWGDDDRKLRLICHGNRNSAPRHSCSHGPVQRYLEGTEYAQKVQLPATCL